MPLEPEDPSDRDEAADEPDIDQQIRINELREKFKEMGGEMGNFGELPPDLEEQFMEQVIAYETSPFASHFEKLEKSGFELTHPDELNDEQVSAKLKDLIEALYKQHTVLERTNHLSDRELYEHLWHDSLREEFPEMPAMFGPMWCHIDPLGGCSDEDIDNHMRYYADEEERAQWMKDFPDYVMPDHVDPPYNRDEMLPAANHEALPMMPDDFFEGMEDDDDTDGKDVPF